MNSDRSKSQMSVVRVLTVFLHLNYFNVTSFSLDSGHPREAQVFDGVDKLLSLPAYGGDKLLSLIGDDFEAVLNTMWCVFEVLKGSYTLSSSVTSLE